MVATAAMLCLAGPTLAPAEVVQQDNLRVRFAGKLSPYALPRAGRAPVTVSLAGKITTTDGLAPPQLRTMALAINRHGRLDTRGMPACHYHQIQPATTREAIKACPESVIGKGSFSAHVELPEQSPFPSQGAVTAFNGTFHGRHVIYAHVYGDVPLPQSQLLVFELGRAKGGPFGAELSAELPRVAANWGYVTALSLRLGGSFERQGKRRSFFSSGCPAPAGFPGVSFQLARARFGFEDGRVLTSTLTRSCKVSSNAAG